MSKQEKTPLSGRGSNSCVGVRDGSNNGVNSAILTPESTNTRAIVKSVLFTAEQAASYINVKKGTMANWRCQAPERLAFIRVGRCIRYTQSDLDNFINKSRCANGGVA